MNSGTKILLGLLLVAGGIGGVVAITEITELQDDRARLESRLNEVEDELADQKRQVSETVVRQGALAQEVRGLGARPEINIQEVATLLANLRSDVDRINSDVTEYNFRLQDVEFQIRRPTGCFPNDVVYWAPGFDGGLTC